MSWRVVGPLAILVAVAAVAAAGLGAYRIPPADVIRGVFGRIDATADAVLWQVRLPRVVLGCLVGASLGCAGALLQGVFRNPLAEPGVIGVSSGAALGAVVAIATGATAAGSWTIPAAAFVTGLATTLIVYRLARRGARVEVVTLVLTGIAMNALAGALIGLVTFFSDDAALRAITFWNLGSMTSATWSSVAVIAPLAAAGLVLAPRLARALDLLALGERQAGHLGIDVRRTQRVAITLVAVLTAAAVASAGVVVFVGLVIPHLVRLVAGPAHRTIIPASALGGALVVIVADLAARTLIAPIELPLGVLTASLGAPFFLWVITRARRTAGAWA